MKKLASIAMASALTLGGLVGVSTVAPEAHAAETKAFTDSYIQSYLQQQLGYGVTVEFKSSSSYTIIRNETNTVVGSISVNKATNAYTIYYNYGGTYSGTIQ